MSTGTTASTTEGAAAAQPLSATDFDPRFKEAMMAQQSQHLEIVERNALKLLREEQRRSQPSLVDVINNEVETARQHDSHDWQNPINKDNFSNMHQIEQL